MGRCRVQRGRAPPVRARVPARVRARADPHPARPRSGAGGSRRSSHCWSLGTYYATIEPVELGQVESLVGFPAVPDAVVLAARARRRRRRCRPGSSTRGYACAGCRVRACSAASCCVLKLTLLARSSVGFWLLTVVGAGPRGADVGVASSPCSRRVVAVGARLTGARRARPAAYLAANGQLGTARWTYFTVTSGDDGHRGSSALAAGTGGWCGPARAGRCRWHSRRCAVASASGEGGTGSSSGCCSGSCSGSRCSSSSTGGSTTYAMFLVPVGILAGYGLEAVDRQRGHRGPSRCGSARRSARSCVLLVPAAARFVEQRTRVVACHELRARRSGPGRRSGSSSSRTTGRGGVGGVPRPADDTGTAVSTCSGNPLDLYVAGRTAGDLDQRAGRPSSTRRAVWDRLRGELEDARPKQLVVDEFSDRIMRVQFAADAGADRGPVRARSAGPARTAGTSLKTDLPAVP